MDKLQARNQKKLCRKLRNKVNRSLALINNNPVSSYYFNNTDDSYNIINNTGIIANDNIDNISNDIMKDRDNSSDDINV